MEWFELCDIEKAGQLFQSTTLRAQVYRNPTSTACYYYHGGLVWHGLAARLRPASACQHAGSHVSTAAVRAGACMCSLKHTRPSFPRQRA